MKTFLRAFLVGLLLGSVTAYGQSSVAEFQAAYENALLDSLARYERLKPTYTALQGAYSQQGKEVTAHRHALRLSEMLGELQKEQDAAIIGKLERKIRRIRRRNVVVNALIIGGAVYLIGK